MSDIESLGISASTANMFPIQKSAHNMFPIIIKHTENNDINLVFFSFIVLIVCGKNATAIGAEANIASRMLIIDSVPVDILIVPPGMNNNAVPKATAIAMEIQYVSLAILLFVRK